MIKQSTDSKNNGKPNKISHICNSIICRIQTLFVDDNYFLFVEIDYSELKFR